MDYKGKFNPHELPAKFPKLVDIVNKNDGDLVNEIAVRFQHDPEALKYFAWTLLKAYRAGYAAIHFEDKSLSQAQLFKTSLNHLLGMLGGCGDIFQDELT